MIDFLTFHSSFYFTIHPYYLQFYMFYVIIAGNYHVTVCTFRKASETAVFLWSVACGLWLYAWARGAPAARGGGHYAGSREG